MLEYSVSIRGSCWALTMSSSPHVRKAGTHLTETWTVSTSFVGGGQIAAASDWRPNLPPMNEQVVHAVAARHLDDKDVRKMLSHSTNDPLYLNRIVNAAPEDERDFLVPNGLHMIESAHEFNETHKVPLPSFGSDQMIEFLSRPEIDPDSIDEYATRVVDGEETFELANDFAQSAHAGTFGSSMEKYLSRVQGQRESLSGNFESWGMPLLDNGRKLPDSTFGVIAALAPSTSKTDQTIAHAWTERTRPTDQMALAFPD